MYFEISYVLLSARQHHLLSLLLPIASENATETQDADFCRMLCPDFGQICYILIYTICWKLMKPSVVSLLWQLVLAIPIEEGDSLTLCEQALIRLYLQLKLTLWRFCLQFCGYSNCKGKMMKGQNV